MFVDKNLVTVLEWRWKAWNETSQVSMKQRWGCYVYTYFNASANLLIEISGRKKKSTYYMYELFLNWLINLNEGKINENPIFFLSYRSHFFKVSLFFFKLLTSIYRKKIHLMFSLIVTKVCWGCQTQNLTNTISQKWRWYPS